MSAQTQMAKIARQYAEQVVAGEILACKWVKAACQRQLNDLVLYRGKSSPYRFNPKLADRHGRVFYPADNLCALIGQLPHVKGPLAGESITLEPWQVFILSTVFGWVNPDGKRRFRRSYIEVPRGNAKSTLSSAVALYMLAADREGGAEVYSLATTRDQARIVFGDAQTMARRSPGFRNRFSVNVGAHNMNVLASGSKFEALSAEGSTLDGLNIHFGCVDELHAHKTRTVYDVVETGTGKRDNSLLWVITTAGSNRAGICYEVRTFVTKLLDGVFQDDTQFGIIYGLDDGDDWTSEEALIKANPNWGISVRPEVLLPLQAKAMQLPSAVNNFKTKHLNEWVNADTAWMDMRAWDACADATFDIESFVGQPCWIGLDLASKTDIAALLVLFNHPEISDAFVAFGKYYLPEDTVNGAGNSQYGGWMHSGRLIVTPASFAKAVWIVNNDVLPALFTLTLGNYPIYLPMGLNVGGIQVSPYGTLLGRPVFVSQHANSFSGAGDVLLADLSYYQTITKAGGMQTATSMHLYFDADLTAFRTTFRMDGQSKIAAPIAPAKGSATMSPFIQLGAR